MDSALLQLKTAVHHAAVHPRQRIADGSDDEE